MTLFFEHPTPVDVIYFVLQSLVMRHGFEPLAGRECIGLARLSVMNPTRERVGKAVVQPCRERGWAGGFKV